MHPPIGVYVISLSERSDRRAAIRIELNQFGIPEPCFVLRERDPRGGSYGAFGSHLHVWRLAQEPYVLVFEDDACLTTGAAGHARLDQLARSLLEAAQRYDIIYLGACSHGPCEPSSLPLAGVEAALYAGKFTLMHAYFAKTEHLLRRVLPRIERYANAGVQPDLATMSQLSTSQQAAIIPPVFVQRAAHDTDNPWFPPGRLGRILHNYFIDKTVRDTGRVDFSPVRSGLTRGAYRLLIELQRLRSLIGGWLAGNPVNSGR